MARPACAPAVIPEDLATAVVEAVLVVSAVDDASVVELEATTRSLPFRSLDDDGAVMDLGSPVEVSSVVWEDERVEEVSATSAVVDVCVAVVLAASVVAGPVAVE